MKKKTTVEFSQKDIVEMLLCQIYPEKTVVEIKEVLEDVDSGQTARGVEGKGHRISWNIKREGDYDRGTYREYLKSVTIEID